jgi:arsenate reductase
MKILFLCVANSCRSQLAEGIAKHIFGSKADIRSAGSNPSMLSSYTSRVLEEVGINYQSLHAKSVDDLPQYFVEKIDYVITLCAEDICPVIPSNAKRLHWPLPDPLGRDGSEEEILERFRITREEIRKRLEQFKKELQ